MPKYRITDPRSNKTVELEGDSPPTEQELQQIFAQINAEPQRGPIETAASKATSIGGSPSMIDRALNLLPLAGGAVGGIIGGAGGTAFGLGFGGVPGAVGGATFGGATGEAFREHGRRILGGKRNVPNTPEDAAKAIGVEAVTQGAIEAGGQAIGPIVRGGAEQLMRGYLKPSLRETKIAKAREIVKTALDEALPVTKAGEERAGRVISDLNKQVNSILATSGKKVDLHQVAERVRTWAKTKYYKPGVDAEDYRAALEVADLIDNHPSLGLPPGVKPTRVNVSAAQANEVKQAVRPPSRAYGQRGAAAETAARKEAGHEMRVAIEGVEPSVGPFNARESKLIDAQEALSRAAGREENRNPLFGVPTLVSGLAGGAYGAYERDPASGLAITLALRVGLSPAVATRAAILASRLAKTPGWVPANAARTAVAMMQSEPEEQPQQPIQP